MLTLEEIRSRNITEWINGMIAENYYTVKPVTELQALRIYAYMIYAEKCDPWQSWPDYLEYALNRYEMLNAAAEFAAVRKAIETGNIFK